MIGEVGVWVADRLVRLEKVLGKIEGLWAEVQFIGGQVFKEKENRRGRNFIVIQGMPVYGNIQE